MGKYHDILGVKPGTSKADIKKAFKRLAKEWHPDQYAIKNPNATDEDKRKAEERFKEINEAWQGLEAGRTGPDINAEARAYAGEHFRDFEASIAEQLRRAKEAFVQSQTGFDIHGKADVHVNLGIRAGLLMRGGEFEIPFNVPVFSDNYWQFEHRRKKIKLEPNTPVGKNLRFPGEGGTGAEGSTGDLVMTLHATDDRPYHVDQIDLVAPMRVDFFEAMLGTTRKVKHIDGEMIEITVPPGIPNGAILTIPEKGLLHVSGMVGDFLVHIRVQPPELTDDQREILREAVNKIREKSS